MFIVASQAKGIHQYKNVKNSLVRINILLFKINHSCGAGNNVNNFLQNSTTSKVYHTKLLLYIQ